MTDSEETMCKQKILCHTAIFFSVFMLVLLTAQIVTGQRETPEDRQAIINGLRWWNDWQIPLPASDSFECQGGRSGDNEFAYCEPGHVEIAMWWDSNQVSRVSMWMTPTLGDTVKGLTALFGQWREPIIQLNWSLPSNEILENDPGRDFNTTEMFYNKTSVIADRYSEPGTEIFYPWVSRGDPQYHVYVAREGKIIEVLSFQVEKHSIPDFPSFTFDSDHANIPFLAERNLMEPQRWYQVIRIR